VTTQRNVPYAPSAQAPPGTEEVAHCAVCGAQWMVRSENRDDARACSFCDAPEKAIAIVSESPSYGKAQRS